MQRQDEKNNEENKAFEMQMLGHIKGIRETEERKVAQTEKNGETLSKIAEALLRSMAN